MAHQDSVRSKQPNEGEDINTSSQLSEKADIFDQLQNEFDALVSGSEPDMSPPEIPANPNEDWGDLIPADQPSDSLTDAEQTEEQGAETEPSGKDPLPLTEPSGADLDADDELQLITDPESPEQAAGTSDGMTPSEDEKHDEVAQVINDEMHSESVSSEDVSTAHQEPDVFSSQETTDNPPSPAGQSLLADVPDETIRANANELSGNLSQASEKTPGIPARMIMLIGLAVAMLMAAVAGSFWAFNDSDSQDAVSDRLPAKDLRQVVIKKVPRAIKYIPIDKSGSGASNPPPQSIAHASQTPSSQQSSMQSGTNHGATKQIPTSPLGGDWIINLESFDVAGDAKTYVAKLTGRDIHADILAVKIKGKAWYRVRTPGFPSQQEAEKQRLILVKKLGLKSAWISKSRH